MKLKKQPTYSRDINKKIIDYFPPINQEDAITYYEYEERREKIIHNFLEYLSGLNLSKNRINKLLKNLEKELDYRYQELQKNGLLYY